MVEKKIQEKEKEYAQAKGKKFTKAGDFNQMANSLKSKTSKYNDMMNIMKELKSEIACLVNTEIVLKKDLEEVESQLANIEKERGIEGSAKTEEMIEKYSEQQEDLNKKKYLTSEEISKRVLELEEKLESKRKSLTPQAQAFKTLKEKCLKIEEEYNVQKQKYEAAVMKVESELNSLQSDMSKVENDYLRDETRYHTLQMQSSIHSAIQKKVNNEVLYKSSADKKLNNQFKSYSDWYKNKQIQQDQSLKELKSKQKYVKENLDKNSKQVVLYGNLKKLLEFKSRSLKSNSKNRNEYGYGNSEEQNRLVIG